MDPRHPLGMVKGGVKGRSQQGLKGPWAGVRGGLWFVARGSPTWLRTWESQCISLAWGRQALLSLSAVPARPLSPAALRPGWPAAEGPAPAGEEVRCGARHDSGEPGPGPPAAHHPGLCSRYPRRIAGVGARPRPREQHRPRGPQRIEPGLQPGPSSPEPSLPPQADPTCPHPRRLRGRGCFTQRNKSSSPVYF